MLGVFGLSIRTRERDLEDEFSRCGDVEKVVIVYDQRVSFPCLALQQQKLMCHRATDPEVSVSLLCALSTMPRGVSTSSTVSCCRVEPSEWTFRPLRSRTTPPPASTWEKGVSLFSDQEERVKETHFLQRMISTLEAVVMVAGMGAGTTGVTTADLATTGTMTEAGATGESFRDQSTEDGISSDSSGVTGATTTTDVETTEMIDTSENVRSAQAGTDDQGVPRPTRTDDPLPRPGILTMPSRLEMRR